MGNKQSSSKTQTPNYGTRMASTHDISDLKLQEKTVDVMPKKEEKTGPPPCPGIGCDGCWVCDWD
jgi:hypothetical protein